MALNPIQWLDQANAIARLFSLEKDLRALIQGVQAQINELKERQARLEGGVIENARSARTVAGNAAANASMFHLHQVIAELQLDIQLLKVDKAGGVPKLTRHDAPSDKAADPSLD